MAHIRQPAVAGMFYPANPDELHGTIARYLAEAEPEAGDITPPKAIIAPHAGYPFSGPVAARTYAHLRPLRGRISRVVLLGPSHRVAFAGLATSRADFFRTPLGDVPVDRAACEQVEALPQVQPIDQAHLQEHSLEVHLPFLQEVLGEFALVPLVVGDAEAGQVAEVLDMLWGGEETLIVISSDLSHYHDYVTARERDSRTSEAIRTLRYEAIDHGDACGRNPINGLLAVARRRGMSAAVVDTRNSGDTAGPPRSGGRVRRLRVPPLTRARPHADSATPADPTTGGRRIHPMRAGGPARHGAGPGRLPGAVAPTTRHLRHPGAL